MSRKPILKLVAGFRKFRDKNFVGESSIYSRLSAGQSPKILVIGCSDSRVDPAILSEASPGEIFVVRNVANLVPPYESANTGFHGVSAAIEFAVANLKVEHVVILGHRFCGGIAALMAGNNKRDSFVGQWMSIANPAKSQVLQKHSDEDFESQCKHCEHESIVNSIANLKTFPFVQDAIAERGMSILGIYFDLEKGELHEYDESHKEFKPIDLLSAARSLSQLD